MSLAIALVFVTMVAYLPVFVCVIIVILLCAVPVAPSTMASAL